MLHVVVLALCAALFSTGHVTGRNIRGADDELLLLERLLDDAALDEERRDLRRDLEVDERGYADDEISSRQKRTVDPNKFLEKFGYLEKLPPGGQHDNANRAKAIREFQRMYNLKQTGIIDRDTQQAMLAPRCGFPDREPEVYHSDTSLPEGKRSLMSKRFQPPLGEAYKWDKNRLTFHFRSLSDKPGFSQDAQRSAIRRALDVWEGVSPLTFVETQDTGDINIQFSSGQHQDGPQNAFDGPGGVLAHAFYPRSGESHFDATEDWVDDKEEGIDLMQVAAHELGHALGLQHTDVPGALMAPYYHYEASFTLPDDDRLAIQSIYGSRETRPVTPQPVKPEKPTVPPPQVPECSITFGAATQVNDGSIHVFSGRNLYRLTETGGLDAGFPVTIKDIYKTAPDTVDSAAYNRLSTYTFLFKGTKVWKYQGFKLIGGHTINVPGYSGADAAFTEQDGLIYLMKGRNCFLFNEASMSVSSSRACDEAYPNRPPNINSALKLDSDPTNVYFFSGIQYYKYNEDLKQVVRGYPKQIGPAWIGSRCSGGRYVPK